MSGPDECACGTPTRDHAYMCETCTDQLAIALGDVPAIVEELETTLTGAKAAAQSGPADKDALHWNEKAGDLLRELRLELTGDVRICVKAHIRHSSPHPGLPANTPQAASRWLLWRVDGLAYTSHGPGMLSRLQGISRRTERLIDNTAPRQYLGTCTAPDCGGAIYARQGEPTGRCDTRECRTEYDVEASRRNLEDALDGRLCTAAEIARLSTYLGLPVPRDTVRKRVHYWHRQGRIIPHTTSPDGTPMFTYGDVRHLLASLEA